MDTSINILFTIVSSIESNYIDTLIGLKVLLYIGFGKCTLLCMLILNVALILHSKRYNPIGLGKWFLAVLSSLPN
jgi:hypothetical protein